MNPQKTKTIISNRVRSICEARGLDRTRFVGECLRAGIEIQGRRLTADTAGRVYDGETNISLVTASLVASTLGVELSQIFDIK